ncbi:site-specific integrase [Bacillus wiedmannii]|uniref:site-specific integrase n=1 Tax=Bacillus wiedmannii TaxID=1890302 RepID=UPI000BED2D0B|nr:site-specific integrase [Bacillus wiedmannii]PEF39529.1 hypothetical protein CON72_10725 [Bacillus wiedmannii]
MCDCNKIEEDIKDLIREDIQDVQLKRILIPFLEYYFLCKKNDTVLAPNKIVLGWIILIANLRRKKVYELDHNFLSKISHSSNLIDKVNFDRGDDSNSSYYLKIKSYDYSGREVIEARKYFLDILKNMYVFMFDNKIFSNLRTSKEIRWYINYLTEDTGIKIFDKSFFLIKGTSERIKIVNGKTSFIEKLLKDFFDKANQGNSFSGGALHYFIYFFTDSLGKETVNFYEGFNESLFEKQYIYFKCLEKKIIQNVTVTLNFNLRRCLVMFYRFVINEATNENIKLFTPQFRYIIYSKSFYKYYEEGYVFVYHNKLEYPPQQDKICVLPDISNQNDTSCENMRCNFINLTSVNQSFKEDLRQFLWYSTGNLRNTVNYISKLIEFLNYTMEYHEIHTNVIQLNRDNQKTFSQDMLYEYRSMIELETKSTGHLKGILKIVRKYLSHYEKKYNVLSSDLAILNLKGLGTYRGGTPITESDCKVIYKEFKKQEEKNRYGKIYTIIFELFMLTNLRIGEILNLKRNCITYENSNSIVLKYKSKTSNNESVSQNISPEVALLIEQALSLTDKFIKDNEQSSIYLFITPYHSSYVDKNKRIDFYTYFKKKIITSVSSRLDNKDYAPYDIRHTFINNVYREGKKQGLTIAEMAAITGNSYKTANQYYRMFNEIDLYVEAMAQVTITDVDIHGNILKDDNKILNNNVKGDLGKCSNESCVFGIGECLLCEHFITFINRIPNFQREIKRYNYEISKSKNPLEIEELNLQKKMLAKYVAEMYKISAEKETIG